MPFADAGVVQVAFLAAVALHRIEAGRAAAGQHLARVADHEQRAHRLALAPVAADLDGQVDDDLQRIERHAGFQLPQVAAGEPVEVLVQVDDAQRIDRIGVEAAVEGDHAGAGGQAGRRPRLPAPTG